MRRSEVALVVGLVVAVIVAAIAGSRVAPEERLRDPRRSTRLSGPRGASALRDALERLGVSVEQRRTALFGIGTDAAAVDSTTWLALLDVSLVPSPVEWEEIVAYVRRGGRVFLAGRNRVENCFGYEVEWLERREIRSEGVPVVRPPGIEMLPRAEYALRRVDRNTAERRCTAPPARTTMALLRTTTGRFVALRLDYDGGGRVILLADGAFVSNRALRETDAGVAVLGWLLESDPARIIADEYHQGFGRSGSLFAAAWAWLLSAPAGWLILQLVAAGILGLVVVAVRFGPPRSVIERRRRSPLEHVDALAVGLERAQAHRTVVALLVAGLRRRLSRVGRLRRERRGGDLDRWLRGLALAARTPEARRTVQRLAYLLHEPGGDEHVRDTALAVEDVWNSLGRTNGSRRSSRR